MDTTEMLDSCTAFMFDEVFDEISRQQIIENRSLLRQESGSAESLPDTAVSLFDAVKQLELKTFLLKSLEHKWISNLKVVTTVEELRKVIEAAIAVGATPDLHDLAISMSALTKPEACPSNNEVVALLLKTFEGNHSLITKQYGLSEFVFNAGMEKLKTLGVAFPSPDNTVQYDEEYLNTPTFLRKMSSFGRIEKNTV